MRACSTVSARICKIILAVAMVLLLRRRRRRRKLQKAIRHYIYISITAQAQIPRNGCIKAIRNVITRLQSQDSWVVVGAGGPIGALMRKRHSTPDYLCLHNATADPTTDKMLSPHIWYCMALRTGLGVVRGHQSCPSHVRSSNTGLRATSPRSPGALSRISPQVCSEVIVSVR